MEVGNRAFSQIYDQFKPGMLGRGSSEHLRGDLGGTKLYTHSAFSISGSGAQAAERRQAKWAAGADHVKQAISQQYGDGVGEQVFKKILGDTGRDLNKELLRGDLGRIKSTIAEVVASRKHLEGDASLAFGRAVQDSINDKFGPEGDLSQPKKFEGGIHVQFKADSNRASYSLNGTTLPKSKEAVAEAFREALSEEELQAVTGMLHQGASLAVIEQLIFTDTGPIQGQLGAAPTSTDESGQAFTLNERGGFLLDSEGAKIPGKSSTYSLERTKEGVLKVTIEDRTQLQSCGTMGDDGMPQMQYLDAARSSLYTKITGEIRPGENPMFRITQPIEYDLHLTPS